MSRHFWTNEEIDILINAYEKQIPLKDIVSEVNHSWQSIKAKARKLELKYRDYKDDDVLGKTFGRLKAVRNTGKKTISNGYIYECYCNCGNKEPVFVPRARLAYGVTKSCGCLRKENTSKMFKKSNTYDLSGDYGIGYCNNNGKEFYFDLEDYDKIKDYCWSESEDGYIRTNLPNRQSTHLHNIVLGVKSKDLIPDHIGGELTRNDNRKSNLRLATKRQNNINKKMQRNNTTGVTGISYIKGKWKAFIGTNNKTLNLGLYDTKEEAIAVRKEAEEKYFGEWSYDNSQKMNGEFKEE